jgi:hypothetical protein
LTKINARAVRLIDVFVSGQDPERALEGKIKEANEVAQKTRAIVKVP